MNKLKNLLQKDSPQKTQQTSIPFPSSSSYPNPIPIQNRYNPLIPLPLIPRNPSSSSSFRPRNLSRSFSDSSPPISYAQSITQSFTPKSSEKFQPLPYIENPQKQSILLLDNYFESLFKENPYKLYGIIFYRDIWYCESDIRKTPEYYSEILRVTKSIEIYHNFEKSDSSKISYSKAKIFKVLTPEDWKQPLFSMKALDSYPEYPCFSYYDYMDAWFKAFMVRPNNHTWFFYFINFSDNYPKWFVSWYKYFGIFKEVLPSEVLKGFQKLKKLINNPALSDEEYLLLFSVTFKIPWILGWNFSISESSHLSRQYKVKWWKDFKTESADEKAVQEFYDSLNIRSSSPASSSSTTELEHYHQKLSDLEDQLKNSTPAEVKKIRRKIEILKELYEDSQEPYPDPYEEEI